VIPVDPQSSTAGDGAPGRRLPASLRVGAPTPLGGLVALAARRPIAIELDPTLDRALAERLVPGSRFARLAAIDLPSVTARERGEADEIRTRAELGSLLGRDDVGDRAGLRAALLWYDLTRVDYHCGMGRRGAAGAALREASALAPGDRTLAALADACGLGDP
jgi:hypothetical protein